MSRSQVQGLSWKSSQIAVKLASVASVRPPRSLPKNIQLLRPIPNGLRARSEMLLCVPCEGVEDPRVGADREATFGPQIHVSQTLTKHSACSQWVTRRS